MFIKQYKKFMKLPNGAQFPTSDRLALVLSTVIELVTPYNNRKPL
jgi:hypothetical protein